MKIEHSRLAIVIPVYKVSFFRQTLESIANQTCKNFTVYIGDDASPHNVSELVEPFKENLQIIYKRFDDNLGNLDLTAHWKRCLKMIEGEEWIWLFSDDDLMDSKCVESFYRQIKNDPNEILLHFNVEIINQNNQLIKKPKPFPLFISSQHFFEQKIKWKIESFVVEYIFNRMAFEGEGGIVPFDLGWCSDDATWIKLARLNGIKTIIGPVVKWRYSQTNISSYINDKSILLRKLQANFDFINWSSEFFSLHSINEQTTKLDKSKWMFIGIFQTTSLKRSEKYSLIVKYLSRLSFKNITIPVLFWYLYFELKYKLKDSKQPKIQ